MNNKDLKEWSWEVVTDMGFVDYHVRLNDGHLFIGIPEYRKVELKKGYWFTYLSDTRGYGYIRKEELTSAWKRHAIVFHNGVAYYVMAYEEELAIPCVGVLYRMSQPND